MIRAAGRFGRTPVAGSALLRQPKLATAYFNGLSRHGGRWTSAYSSSYQLMSCFGTLKPNGEDKNDLSAAGAGKEVRVEVKKSKVDVVVGALKSAGAYMVDIVMNPRATWQSIKHEINHYWMGSKLLWSEIKITKDILARVVAGHAMTRRERKQLIRTTTDIFRLVPFAIFVIVPFMELTLPFFLKLFPNMLPSTFQDSLKKEESLKKELHMRLAVATFMQETLRELANKREHSGGETAMDSKEIVDVIHKAQQGQVIPTDAVLKIARLFRDDLTLDNISRPQLVSLCTYMGLQSYGSDTLLRFLLRSKLRKIKDDDRRILWEGVDSLNTIELREACAERGMRSLGLTQFQLKHQLTEWLELSTHQNVPISLLIMSRALTLSHAHELPTQALRSSLSSLDSDTINEVVIAAAKGQEEDSIDIRKRKLESLKFQQEMIDEERAKTPSIPIEAIPIPVASKEAASPTPLAPPTTAPVAAGLSEERELPAGAVPTPSGVGVAAEPAVMAAAAGAAAHPTPSTTSLLAPPSETRVPVAVPHKKKELTLQELQALVDLARGSALQREKNELNILQGTLKSLLRGPAPAPAPSADSPTGKQADTAVIPPPLEEERVGNSESRMRTVLNNMIKRLEVQMESAEKTVGDKFNVLDKDGDGQLTAHELREAIIQLMRREFSLQEADQLVDILDDDKDGKVSLVDFLLYIEQQRENLEIESMKSPLQGAPGDSSPPLEQAVGSRLVSESHK